ncbi:FdtA/QdtA family cupin domain-containing protein [Candidatus Thioglobus sp.]|nr:FdtA/QdtA family cupin domain-containing protein [Candidatus Thioglobus sp.]
MDLIKFNVFSDDRGSLISLEENKNIPFSIKRIYYIYGMPVNSKRGFHAHKNLKQVITCVSGSCKILLDNGVMKRNVELNSINNGLIVESMIWREIFDFSEDCILIVLASELYREDDYIRNYDEFLKKAKA